MKLLETLTDSDYTKMFAGTPTALFSEIFYPEDVFYSKVGRACSEYYTNHSGNKNISPFYEILIEKQSATIIPENVLGRTIRSKFIDKWNKLYNLIETQTYNVLDGYTDAESVISTEKEKVNNHVSGTRGTETSTDITTTNSTNSDNTIYGFNSATPVGDTGGSTSGSTNVKGIGNSNTEDVTTSETADRTSDKSDTYTKTKSGRDKTASELISEEIDFRNYRIFFNIVYNDIDSLVTQPTYN